MVSFKIRVIEFRIPGIFPVEIEHSRCSQVTEINDWHRLVISDETDGDYRPSFLIQRRDHGQLFRFPLKRINDLGIKHALVRRRRGNGLAGIGIDHAGKG